MLASSPDPGTEKMLALLGDPVLWEKTKAKMGQHVRMTAAVRGKSACLSCGWIADATDAGWNLDAVPECIP